MSHLPPGYGLTCQFLWTGTQWPQIAPSTPAKPKTQASPVHFTSFCCFNPKLILCQSRLPELSPPRLYGKGPHVRDAVVEAEYATFQRPDKGYVKVPTHQQAFGTELEASDLFVSQGRADFVVDANVGTILACVIAQVSGFGLLGERVPFSVLTNELQHTQLELNG